MNDRSRVVEDTPSVTTSFRMLPFPAAFGLRALNGLRALDVFGAGLRALATVYDWQPPVAADAGGAS